MPRSAARHNRIRLAFSSYGVNSRGEVIPVHSIGFGLTESQANELSDKAITKVRDMSLKNIKSLSYL